MTVLLGPLCAFGEYLQALPPWTRWPRLRNLPAPSVPGLFVFPPLLVALSSPRVLALSTRCRRGRAAVPRAGCRGSSGPDRHLEAQPGLRGGCGCPLPFDLEGQEPWDGAGTARGRAGRAATGGCPPPGPCCRCHGAPCAQPNLPDLPQRGWDPKSRLLFPVPMDEQGLSVSGAHPRPLLPLPMRHGAAWGRSPAVLEHHGDHSLLSPPYQDSPAGPC